MKQCIYLPVSSTLNHLKMSRFLPIQVNGTYPIDEYENNTLIAAIYNGLLAYDIDVIYEYLRSILDATNHNHLDFKDPKMRLLLENTCEHFRISLHFLHRPIVGEYIYSGEIDTADIAEPDEANIIGEYSDKVIYIYVLGINRVYEYIVSINGMASTELVTKDDDSDSDVDASAEDLS